jgi:porin
VDAGYTGEIWRNVTGGLTTDYDYIDNLDLTMEVDAERAFGWAGATFFAYFLMNTGADLSTEIVGDAQVVSNIDAPPAKRLFELWYEQLFLDDRASVKAGLYDLNSEFDVIETAGLFINSSHGIGPDFSQAGLNGPSIFPVTSVGLRARYAFAETLSIQAVVLDGVPGDPDDPSRTAIQFNHGDGALIAVELDYVDEAGTKVALGGWHFTERFDDVFATDAQGNPIRRHGNQGVYALGERVVYREPVEDAAEGHPGRPRRDLYESSDQGLSVFLRFGVADEDLNQFSHYIGVGGVYTGLIPGRDEDQLGIAAAIARNGDSFKDSLRAAGDPARDQEVSIELTYHLHVTPWLALQPDVQYIVDPGAGAGGDLDDALAVGLRFGVAPF